MKKLYIVGNWKSHKTVEQAHAFLISFFNSDLSNWLHKGEHVQSKEVILCPPSTLLSILNGLISTLDHKNISIKLGAQDISQFDEGSHTGEESGTQLKEFVNYCIIGHSERRKEQGETDEVLIKKVKEAISSGIEPIFCVQNKETFIPSGVRIVAYEPVEAIGSGDPASVQYVSEMANFFKKEKEIHYCLYGGSVTPENVASYTGIELIDGVLVGGSSLDPEDFSQIVIRA